MKRAGILGLGRVGRSILSHLVSKKDEILLYDEDSQAYLHRYVKLSVENGQARVVNDPYLLKDSDIIIKSPGIPNDALWLKQLDATGAEIVDEVEFTWRELGKPRTVAITGTNGKSTTTAWTTEVLKAGGLNIFCGGNIAPGRPFSDALSETRKDVYVIEISTFQLERCPTFRPGIGVLLNVTDDHLNRHTSAEYLDLKLSLFKNASNGDASVLNADASKIMNEFVRIGGKHVLFSLERKDVDAFLDNGDLVWRGDKIISRKQLPLPGRHNVANALAVICVASYIGLDPERIESGLKSFSGLPHRMQYLGVIEGHEIYNNSMCTNPEAFYHSLYAFDEPSVVIAGGTEKGLSIEPFLSGVKERARFVVLFGENAGKLKGILESKLNFSSCVIVDSLRAALEVALEKSTQGERILFAPGFASFGNFKNFEERGDAFIKAYRDISKKH